jgi:hypothetical protein
MGSHLITHCDAVPWPGFFGYWPDIHELDVPPVNAVDVIQQISGINFGAVYMGQINV